MLIKQEGYPFKLFPKEAYKAEDVDRMIAVAYAFANESEASYNRIPSATGIALNNIHLLSEGAFAHVYYGYGQYEDTPQYSSEELTDYIHELMEGFDYDLSVAHQEFISSVDWRRYRDKNFKALFDHDVAASLQRQRMFYVTADGSYDSLFVLSDENGNIGHPFSDKNIDKHLKNIPIVRVW